LDKLFVEIHTEMLMILLSSLTSKVGAMYTRKIEPDMKKKRITLKL